LKLILRNFFAETDYTYYLRTIMAGNSFGEIFRITTFGESHGEGIGVVIDGCPAGLFIDESYLQTELDRRKPGQSTITTQRKESDTFRLLSGVFKQHTTGAPIAIFIPNEDARSADYEALKDKYRPSHADYTYDSKYGIRDDRGGGRSSARETAARVVAGAIAKLFLQHHNIHLMAYVSEIGKIKCTTDYRELRFEEIEKSMVRCPEQVVSEAMIKLIEKAKKEGDSLGGVIKCIVRGMPAGLGEPVFDKLHADIGKAMLSINAVKGFDYGSGFAGTKLRGSEHNDSFKKVDGKVVTTTNFSGGIQGGISNGMDFYCQVAFKPTATISQEQDTIDKKGNQVKMEVKGRHDPCVVPRAVPIVEAMAALTIADHFLRNKIAKL
jgi:chorismate synthase